MIVLLHLCHLFSKKHFWMSDKVRKSTNTKKNIMNNCKWIKCEKRNNVLTIFVWEIGVNYKSLIKIVNTTRMQLGQTTIKSMHQITTDIANYVKGRLRNSAKMQHIKYYNSVLQVKMFNKKTHLLASVIIVMIHILTNQLCSCKG